MKILLAILLNIGLVLGVGRWLYSQRRLPELGTLVVPLLGLQVAAGLLTVALISDDSQFFLYWSRLMTAQLWSSPTAWVHTLVGDEFHHAGKKLVYHGFSNTFFLMKLLSALNLATLGNALLNGLYLSVFRFMGCWYLVRAIRQTFPATPRLAGVLALLVWPTLLYWTSGVTKECVLVGSLAWLTALVIEWLYGGRPVSVGSAVGGLVLLIVGFKMRFFFSVLLFGGLLALVIIRLVQQLGGARRRWAQVAVLVVVLAGGSMVLSEVSTVFRLNRFTNQLIHNHYELLRVSRNKPHIEFDDLAPTVESVLYNAPKAAFSALFRPFPWEWKRLSYISAGFENLLLLGLTGVALLAVVRGRSGHLPFALVLALLLYCIGLAVLLGLTTPNLGTLNRYRSAMLPFYLLLLLQNDYLRKVKLCVISRLV